MKREKIMKRTIDLAISTISDGNTPFGAIVTKNGEIIAEAVNETTSSKDPTAHAELLAIRKAAKVLNSNDLSGCELYASGEPCTMCLSAIYFTGIQKVYVAYEQKEATKYNIGNPYVRQQLALSNDKRDIRYTLLLPKGAPHPYKHWQNK